MPVYVALLRAVNVGSHNRVPMATLRGALVDGGIADATTYIQTGNVVFTSRARTSKAAGADIEKILRAELGLNVDVMARSASEMKKLLGTNPFKRRGADLKTLHVGFLKARPTAAAAKALSALTFEPEEHALKGTELYLRYPGGMGRTKMTPSRLERALATPITARNWAVVTKLCELADAHGKA
jgi:uncharacterized protein (DUF1697 family)